MHRRRRGRRNPFRRRRRRWRLRSRVGRRGCRRRKLIRHDRGGQRRGQAVDGERARRREPRERDDGRAGEHREPPLRAVGPRPRRWSSFLHPESPSHAAYGHGSTLPGSVHVCCHPRRVATARVPCADRLSAARDDVREAQDEQHRHDPEGEQAHEMRQVRPLQPRRSQPTCGSPQFHLSLPGGSSHPGEHLQSARIAAFASRVPSGLDVAAFLTYDRGSRFLG